MNVFLDHDVPSEVGRMLRLKGHRVEFLHEVLAEDTDDLPALNYAVNHGMVVITCNRRDFLRLAKTEPHVGIIILVRRRTRVTECAAVLRLLQRAGESGIANTLISLESLQLLIEKGQHRITYSALETEIKIESETN